MRDRLRSIRRPWKGMIGRQKALLRENIEREEEFLSMEFSEVLRAWGVYNAADRHALVISKRRECMVGLFLLVFGTVGGFFQVVPSVVISLGAVASFSVALLGAILLLTSCWRLCIIKKQRFVPFLKWLKHCGNV